MSPNRNFIRGDWREPRSGEYDPVYDPADPTVVVGEFPRSNAEDVDEAVSAAHESAVDWAETPGPKRAEILRRFAGLLEQSTGELGEIVTREMGKPLTESVGEVERAAQEARFMAGECSRPFGHTYPSEVRDTRCKTVREPLGVVATISPWNFPVVTPVRKIAPALAYGNTVVFKPASQTSWSSIYLFELLERAGLPSGVANLVIGSGRVVGNEMVEDDRVRGVSFTGSTNVGVRINRAAADQLTRVQLELGGKNPALVLGFDDLERAAREIVSAALKCSGQRCTALSRVLVLDSQADELVERLLDEIGQIEVGPGLAETTTMGPLVDEDQFETVVRFVRTGKDSGAELRAGGEVLVDDPNTEGYFHEPTLFDHVARTSPLAREEIFGPVLPVVRVANVEQAISIANDTEYGLAASVFSDNPRTVEACTRQIDAGMIHINHGTASQAHVPFGGHKSSGHGAYSIGQTAREFYTIPKAIYTKW